MFLLNAPIFLKCISLFQRILSYTGKNHPLKFSFLALLAAIVLVSFFSSGRLNSLNANASTDIRSITSGKWSNPSTWNLGRTPRQDDKVLIAGGTIVTYDAFSNEILDGITIDGTLRFSRGKNTRLKTSNNIIVSGNAYLDMGTDRSFIPRQYRSEVIWVLTEASANAFEGGPSFKEKDKGLWAAGKWDVHGAPIKRTWSKLSNDAKTGHDFVIVEHDVTDWYLGGDIVISSTNIPLQYKNQGTVETEVPQALQREDELHTISGLESLGDGKTKIYLQSPVTFDHSGTSPLQGEVALLTRNVLFSTEFVDVEESEFISDVRKRKFAHTLRLAGSQGNTQYSEFKYMGNYGTLARYPIHFHMMGETSKGQIVRGNSGWYTGFRCVNIHISHGVLTEDNVCYDSTSTAFFVEQDEMGFNIDNVFVHNVAIGTNPKHFEDRNYQNIEGESSRVSGFWAGAQTIHEAFLGNVASGGGSAASMDSSGFHFPEAGNGAQVTQGLGSIPFTFVKNEAHSGYGTGINTWQNLSPNRDIVDSLLWRNADAGIRWGAYGAPFFYFNAQILENGRAGVDITTIEAFIQDSIITGSTLDQSLEDTGIFFNAYIAPQSPANPVRFIRNILANLSTGIKQAEVICDEYIEPSIKERPVWPRNCSGFYQIHMGNSFLNTANNIRFGLQPNPNSWTAVFDYVEEGELPDDFVLLRKGLRDPDEQGVITRDLVTSESYYSDDMDAVVVPMDSLQSSIEFTGLLNERDLDEQSKSPSPDFTFTTSADYPPEISLNCVLNGTSIEMAASPSDDNEITKVEFYVDWEKVDTVTSAPYRTTIDLSNHPRKFAYLYAVAYDGVSYSNSNQQKAYSNVVEVGPEVLEHTIPQPSGITGLENVPKDLNGDGLTEDINDNGLLDFDDAVSLYRFITTSSETVYHLTLDFNLDGNLDISDSTELFRDVLENLN